MVEALHKSVSTTHQTLLDLSASQATGKLKLFPSGVIIYIKQGKVQSVEGVEPLGYLIFAKGWLNPAQIDECIQDVAPLGQALMEKNLLEPKQLITLLKEQAEIGVGYALRLPKQTLEWTATTDRAWLGADMVISDRSLHQLEQNAQLPLNHPVRLAEASQDCLLTKQELILLKYINGRRTLWVAMRQSTLNLGQATEAAKGLLRKGLLEPSVLQVLRSIVPEKLPIRSGKQPPASIRANLFLKAIDGNMSVTQIASRIRIRWEDAALVLTGLYRDDLIGIKSGKPMFEQLLEEY